MSELSKLVGKGKKVQLGEIEIEIKPLTASSMPEFIELTNLDVKIQAAAMKKLLKQTIKNSIPDATDEEIDNMPMQYLSVIMTTMMEVNKVEDKHEKAFIDKIKNQ